MDKEQETCEVEKRGCKGCYYDGVGKKDIEVGEYIRTEQGEIDIVKYTGFKHFIKGENDSYAKGRIVNHSHNIIDLIEAGDVLELNGEKYEVIYDESYEKLGVLIPNREHLAIRHVAVKYIFQKYKDVGIVTKEQFKQLEYIVKEK